MLEVLEVLRSSQLRWNLTRVLEGESVQALGENLKKGKECEQEVGNDQ